MKILLVDDDAGSLRGMKLALIMLKHICDAYSDPCEAVKSYSNHTYDLVITDIYMPTINGFTLAKTIRCVNPKAKVIFISGQASEMMDRKTWNDEEKLFLQKPIDFYLLKQMLDHISVSIQTERTKSGLYGE